MGKPTGFLEYEENSAKADAPLETNQTFQRVPHSLTEAEQRKQGAAVWSAACPSASQA